MPYAFKARVFSFKIGEKQRKYENKIKQLFLLLKLRKDLPARMMVANP